MLGELDNLLVDDRKAFTRASSGLGNERGATFLAMTHKDASHLVNIFFARKKLASLEGRKSASLRARKLASHTVYCFNQLNQSIKPSKDSKASESPAMAKIEQRQIGTDSFSREKEKGSYAYQKALKSLEALGIIESDLRVLQRKIYHPITRENATINLSQFVAEFEPKDSRRAFEHYKHEVIHYASEIGKTRQGEAIYQKALSKVRERIANVGNMVYRELVPYVAPTGEIDLEPIEIENPKLRELMEKLGKQIEARERKID